MVNNQNFQHRVYISRQAQNAQILSQSIGDASNASYVFDGGSNFLPTRGGGEPFPSQFARGSAQIDQNGVTHVDNRSISNESSPGSMFSRRNLVYKNVRNFSNLYDNRSMVSKNTELQ